MIDLETVEFFTDTELALDPYPLLDYLAENRRVWREPTNGVVMVAGYAEAQTVLRDPATFSSSTIVSGPKPPFPIEFSGDDITEVVEQYRDGLPQSDQIVAFDPPKHTAHRAILMGLITPKRLQENEAFIWRLTDRQLDAVLPHQRVEFISAYATPYTLLIIADLLGVPEEDHESLLGVSGGGFSLSSTDQADEPSRGADDHNTSLSRWYDYFIQAIEARRLNPTSDVLTGMALSKFPDGTTPEPIDVARIASNLFGAGQETTVRLLGAALHRIAIDAELQALLRERRDLLPKFIEEMLRLEGPIKGEFRLTRKTTTLGGVDIVAGTPVMLLNGAANRDPAHFEAPTELRLDRANVRTHLGFGFGVHTCPGAPLARSEVRITLERLSTGPTTSGSTRPTTARSASAASATCPPTCSAG